MKDLDFTLLETKDIFGEDRLDIFDKYGTAAAITDFVILLGGEISGFRTKEGNDLKDRTGWYFTKTDDGDNDALAVSSHGDRDCYRVIERRLGARPVISYSSILGICSNEVRGKLENIEVEYGEYPQMVVNEEVSKELDILYKNKKLQKTGKDYITDSIHYNKYESFRKRRHIEYVYNEQKYVRLLGNSITKEKQLSNRRIVEYGRPYWVKVEPILWIVDKNRDMAISKKLLFTGVQFCDYPQAYKGDFENTRMKYFLRKFFSKDIVPSKLENIKDELKENEEVVEEIVSNEKDNIEIVPYLVKYENSDETYGAFELDGILRDIITSLKIVNGSEKSNETLKCSSKEKTTFKVLSSYCLNDMSERECLKYALRLSELGKNDKLYQMYLEQIEEDKYKEKVTEYVRNLKIK